MALVAHWPLNGDYLDYSGNGYDLTGTLIPDDNGKIGSCYKKDMTSITALSSTSKPIKLDSSQTYACWVKLDEDNLTSGESITTVLGLFNTHVYTANANIGINFVYVDNYPRMTCNIGYIDETREYNVKKSKHSFSYNIWYHVALVYDEIKNNISFYINGKLDSTFQLEKKVKHISSLIQLFRWSVDYTGYNLLGSINDARLYNHALSSNEIHELSKAKILDWKMNICEEPTENRAYGEILGLDNDRFRLTTVHPGIPNTIPKSDVWIRRTSNTYIAYARNFFTVDERDNPLAYDGAKYSFSCYYYRNTADATTFDIGITGNNGETTYAKAADVEIIGDRNVVGVWTKIEAIITLEPTKYNISQLIYVPGCNGGGDPSDINQFYITAVQFEKKDHSTDYAYGKRDSYITDSSGLKNHGEINITNSPKYKIDENGIGYYEFDGTQEVLVNKKILSSNNQSWTVVFDAMSTLDKNGQFITNFNQGVEYQRSDTGALLYINSGDNDWYRYSDGKLPLNTRCETSFIFNQDNDDIRIYLNGKNVTGRGPSGGGTRVPYGIHSSSIFFSRFVGRVYGIKVFATSFSDDDIVDMTGRALSVDKKYNVSCGEIIENPNIFNPDMIISNKISNSFILGSLRTARYGEYDGRRCLFLGAGSFYDGDYMNIYKGFKFKNETQYKFSCVVNSNLIYQGNEVPAGFRIYYNGSNTDCDNFVFTTSGTWQKHEYTSRAGQTITKVGIYYYIGDTFYVDLDRTSLYEIISDDFINKNKQLTRNIEERIYRKNTNILDYTIWKEGQTGSVDGFSKNGSGDAKRMIKLNPKGNSDIVWACEYTSGTSEGGDGGWNGARFPIDNTRKYRYTVWMKRENIGEGDGTGYFGVLNTSDGVNTAINISDGTSNTNPYFWSGDCGTTDWLLFVSYVYPSSTTDVPSDDGGAYRINGQKVINICARFKFATTAVESSHRTYLYYSGKPDERMYWYRPRVDLCDGSEPSLNDLLNLREHPTLVDFDYNIFSDVIYDVKINKNKTLYCNTISEV